MGICPVTKVPLTGGDRDSTSSCDQSLIYIRNHPLHGPLVKARLYVHVLTFQPECLA